MNLDGMNNTDIERDDVPATNASAPKGTPSNISPYLEEEYVDMEGIDCSDVVEENLPEEGGTPKLGVSKDPSESSKLSQLNRKENYAHKKAGENEKPAFLFRGLGGGLTEAEKRRRGLEVEQQFVAIREEQARAQRARLGYLLGQSDLFKHFLNPEALAETKSESAEQKTPPRGKTPESSAKSPARHLLSKKEDLNASAGARSKRSKTSEEEEEGLASGTVLTVQPSIITGATLRDYQLEGLNWMIQLHENGINGILADEMGLGKTLQSISLLAYCYQYLKIEGPFLILVPKSTITNWQREIARFVPTFRTCTLIGSKEERAQLIKECIRPGMTAKERGWEILLTTYEIAVIESTPLTRIPWQYLIIDEAHRIKNENNTLSMVVRNLYCAHRLLITGTPLQNNLHELWALLNFLLPDVFGSSEKFNEWFDLSAKSDEDSVASAVQQLRRVLRPFMLRRLKVDVAKGLPPKKETIIHVGLTPLQRELYKSILERNLDAVTGGRGSSDRSSLSNIIMHQRKACNHPYLFDNVEDRTLDPMGEHLVENCAKLKLVDKLLPRLQSQKSRVLLFCQMTSLLDIMEDFCNMRGYKYCRIDGQTAYEDRESAIDAYNAPNSEKFIFLLSTRAGGLGINLYTADVVILYDSDWNPQMDLQAMDRAHRIGQTKEVRVFRLVTAGTVEEKIVERAQLKLKLDAVVVQQGKQTTSGALSKEDMLAMIQFGAADIVRSGGKAAEFADEDIDSILSTSEKRTDEFNKSVNQQMEGSALLDFKLDKVTTSFTFEGVDYTKKTLQETGREIAMAAALAMTENTEGRSSKRYHYIEETDSGTPSVAQSGKQGSAKRQAKLPAEYRSPATYHWHLVPKDRIDAINAKLLERYTQWEEEKKSRKELMKKMEKTSVTSAKSATMEGETSVASESDIAIVSEQSALQSSADVNSTPNAEAEGAFADSFPSDPFQDEPYVSLLRERNLLMDSGHLTWKKENLQHFLNAVYLYTRSNPDSVIQEVARTAEKTIEEARRYYEDFWVKGPFSFPPETWSKMMNRIQKEECAYVDRLEAELALHERMSMHVQSSVPTPDYLDKLAIKVEDYARKAGALPSSQSLSASPRFDDQQSLHQPKSPSTLSTPTGNLETSCGFYPPSVFADVPADAATSLRHPARQLPLPTGLSDSEGWTPDMDRFLLQMIVAFGSQDFEFLRGKILQEPSALLYPFLLTRSAEALETRANLLFRSILADRGHFRSEFALNGRERVALADNANVPARQEDYGRVAVQQMQHFVQQAVSYMHIGMEEENRQISKEQERQDALHLTRKRPLENVTAEPIPGSKIVTREKVPLNGQTIVMMFKQIRRGGTCTVVNLVDNIYHYFTQPTPEQMKEQEGLTLDGHKLSKRLIKSIVGAFAEKRRIPKPTAESDAEGTKSAEEKDGDAGTQGQSEGDAPGEDDKFTAGGRERRPRAAAAQSTVAAKYRNAVWVIVWDIVEKYRHIADMTPLEGEEYFKNEQNALFIEVARKMRGTQVGVQDGAESGSEVEGLSSEHASRGHANAMNVTKSYPIKQEQSYMAGSEAASNTGKSPGESQPRLKLVSQSTQEEMRMKAINDRVAHQREQMEQLQQQKRNLELQQRIQQQQKQLSIGREILQTSMQIPVQDSMPKQPLASSASHSTFVSTPVPAASQMPNTLANQLSTTRSNTVSSPVSNALTSQVPSAMTNAMSSQMTSQMANQVSHPVQHSQHSIHNPAQSASQLAQQHAQQQIQQNQMQSQMHHPPQVSMQSPLRTQAAAQVSGMSSPNHVMQAPIYRAPSTHQNSVQMSSNNLYSQQSMSPYPAQHQQHPQHLQHLSHQQYQLNAQFYQQAQHPQFQDQHQHHQHHHQQQQSMNMMPHYPTHYQSASYSPQHYQPPRT